MISMEIDLRGEMKYLTINDEDKEQSRQQLSSEATKNDVGIEQYYISVYKVFSHNYSILQVLINTRNLYALRS